MSLPSSQPEAQPDGDAMEELRAATAKREEELTLLVSNAKSIFEGNLAFETQRLERKHKAAIDEKENEISSLKGLLEAKDDSIRELTVKLEASEEDKVAALRQQRQSVLLTTELVHSDLAQSRAAMEKQRFENESILSQKDAMISGLRSNASQLSQHALNVILWALRVVEAEEFRARKLLVESEEAHFSFVTTYSRSAGDTEIYHAMCEQLLLRKVCESVVNLSRERLHLPQATAIPTTLSLALAADYIVKTVSDQLGSQDQLVLDAQQASARVQEECSKAQSLFQQLDSRMEKFAQSVDARLGGFGASLNRSAEMQCRLRDQMARRVAAQNSAHTTIDEMSSVYESEISALKYTVKQLEQTVSSQVSRSQFEALERALADALALEPSCDAAASSARHTETLHTMKVNSSVAGADAPPFSDVGSHDESAPNPFSWTEGRPADTRRPSVEQRARDEEVEALRNELIAARANVADLKALVRKLRDRSHLHTDARKTQEADDAQAAVTLPDSTTAAANSTQSPLHEAREYTSDQGDGELQMQLFTLKRERDAWKRKADAALAQASHAEEQRLASVHTYLQLVGRKEEEFAHRLLSTASAGRSQETVPERKASASFSDNNSLVPGGSPKNENSNALTGVMQDVRARGEQRAERWLFERAEELKAQTNQLNRLREELTLKASSLARREEALQHEKTGLLLKKGGSRPTGAPSNLLLFSNTHGHQEPLRETVPSTRLQPMLQVPVPTPQPKPHHPQRFVLSPLQK